MNLQEIKSAVEIGEVVCWASNNYRVIKDKIGQFLIGYNIGQMGQNYIELTHSDGLTLSGKERDFFIQSK